MDRRYFFTLSELGYNERTHSDVIINPINELANSVKIISLGIDPIKYAKLRMCSYKIIMSIDGSFTVLKREIDENKFNEENANFCIQFVIECAISLQKIKF
jgi:hypothetical protein